MDIKPEHLFLEGENVTLIDMDSYGCGDPVFDVAMLMVRLRELPNLTTASNATVELAEKELVHHYFCSVPNNWRIRLPVNFACAALKVGLYHVQHQDHHWGKHIKTLLAATKIQLS